MWLARGFNCKATAWTLAIICYVHVFLSYRVTVSQEFQPPDKRKRVTYCPWFQTFLTENRYILNKTCLCNEAWFHLSGYVNRQHTPAWATANSHDIHYDSVLPQNVRRWMWCASSCTLKSGRISSHTTPSTVSLNSIAFNNVERRVTRLTRPWNEWEFPWWQDYNEKIFSSPVSRLHSKKKKLKSMVWVRERTIPTPSDRRLSAKWLPTCADRGCHMVSVTDPSGSILGFLDRSRYFSIKLLLSCTHEAEWTPFQTHYSFFFW
jgi:hypothetical protein